MVDIVTPSLPVYRDRRLSEFAAPGTDVLGALGEEAFRDLPVAQVSRMGDMDEAEEGERVYQFRGPVRRKTPDSPLLDRDSAEMRVKDEGLDGQIEIPQTGIRDRSLGLLIENRKEINRRNAIISRSPGGVGLAAAGLATQLGVSLLDPVNVASAFIPVVGEARYARILANAGSALGRTGIRAGVGAAEGALGAVLLQPLTMATDRAYQEEYSLNDALANIAFGGLFGAVVHNIAPAVRGASRLARGEDVTVKQAALSEALSAHLEGRTPRVSEVLQSVSKPPRVPLEDADAGNIGRSIVDFVNRSVDDRTSRLLRTGPLEDVTVTEAGKHGFDVSGFEHVMQTDDIRHALKKHGVGSPELRADEIPITAEDIARVPEIIATADSVRPDKTGIGRDALIFTKRDGNTLIVVEEIRAGKKRLAFKSMRIKRAGDGSPVTIDASRTPQSIRPEHFSGTAADQNIGAAADDGKFDWADSGVELGDATDNPQSLTDVLTQIRDDRVSLPLDESAALTKIKELAKGFDSGNPVEAQLAEIETYASATDELIALEREAGRITPEMDAALQDAASAVSEADKRAAGFRQAAFCVGRGL